MSAPDFDRTLGFVVHDVARLLRKRFEQNARGLGLTRSQWSVLANVVRHRGQSQAALAELLDIEPITLARIVGRLEALGYVERRDDAGDRRVRRLHPTAQAHARLERMWAIAAETREEAMAGIGADERRRLIDTLLRIRSNLSDRAGVAARPPRKVANG